MPSVYVVHEGGDTKEMSRVRCQNEDVELQRILEKNPDLLPGDQIDPEDPRRWVLLKREMPVPDPSTGSNRWSVDFLFADQDGIPTFVECKRFADTRSRREVVGQMLEYAANGHHYWSSDLLRNCAAASATSRGSSIEEALRSLQPSTGESVEEFFDRIQENLREGQLRIVFFLEESPQELRSVVDFLNRQMERSEVLLVEARQYSHAGTKIVVPTLFGYTEQARQVKRSITTSRAAARKPWDRTSFFADARTKLADEDVRGVEALLDDCAALGCEISWGTGAKNGSFSVIEPTVCPRSLITVKSSGDLLLHFEWLNESDGADRARQRLKELFVQRLGIAVPNDQVIQRLGASEWIGKAGAVSGVLKQLVSECRQEA